MQPLYDAGFRRIFAREKNFRTAYISDHLVIVYEPYKDGNPLTIESLNENERAATELRDVLSKLTRIAEEEMTYLQENNLLDDF